jgi:hypothetical protein
VSIDLGIDKEFGATCKAFNRLLNQSGFSGRKG